MLPMLTYLVVVAEIANHLNLPPVKLHCSMLAEDAVKAAVADWKKKSGKMEEVKA